MKIDKLDIVDVRKMHGSTAMIFTKWTIMYDDKLSSLEVLWDFTAECSGIFDLRLQVINTINAVSNIR